MCANGHEIIKELFITKIAIGMIYIYKETERRVSVECIYLMFVICEKGNNRDRILLYENNVMDVIASEIESDNNIESIYHCLKCIMILHGNH
jgi:hypothetical protein